MNKNTDIGTLQIIETADADRNWRSPATDQLVAGILSLKNADETERFLRDLLTESEIKEFANRFEAARLLMSDVQYNAISESTGLSSTTIARISKWLQGSLGGYRLVLSRLSKSHHHNSSQLRKGLSLNS